MGSTEPAGKAVAQRYLGSGVGWGRLLGSPGARGSSAAGGRLVCRERGEGSRGEVLSCVAFRWLLHLL